MRQPISWWTQKGRGCLGHRETTSPELTAQNAVNVPDSASTAGTRSAAWVAGCRAVEGFRDGNGHRCRADIEFCSAVTGVRTQRGAAYSRRSSTKRKPFTYVTESP
ncbi:hypothetical protein D8S78_20415 [Natrialba swarupiae]|nr:hypothetical protein [Natrialba swarupiae]